MSRSNYAFLAFFVCGVLGTVVSCLLGPASTWVIAEAPPPLVVDQDSPLLLDEPDPADATSEDEADNLACYVCHANYKEDPFVNWHAAHGIGCVDCHGDSFDHRNDENNTTPPETMYPREKIDPACRQCHETHDAPASKVIAVFQERCPATADPKSLVCTDCHGQHRLKVRTVRWDKSTGKLLSTLEK